MAGQSIRDCPTISEQVFYRDSLYLESYYNSLGRFASVSYLDSLFGAFDGRIKSRERFLQREYAFYRLNKATIYDRAARIRRGMALFEDSDVRKENTSAGTFLYNYNLIPVKVLFEGTGKKVLLGAWDGEIRPDSVKLEGDARYSFRALGICRLVN